MSNMVCRAVRQKNFARISEMVKSLNLPPISRVTVIEHPRKKVLA